MRLLAVRLQNLNSLSGAHEVRFDAAPLSSAGVFLITGPTGAGKSTLLDAMTLALYGRAARYGNDKADEMMSRHAAECLAEVDFETGGRKLRATWRLRRARGKADGKLQPVERRLADADSGDILGEKAGEMDRLIEEMTGLDAQRFLRSVLLAQGQFAAFLKAKPNERAELLEKITGTEIYSDLSVLAFETHKAKDEAARLLKERLGALSVLDDESRAVLEKNIAEARTAASQLQTASQTAAKRLNEQRELMQRQREHAEIVKDSAKIIESDRALKNSQAEAAAAVEKARSAAETAKQSRTQREPVWEQAAGMAAQSGQFETQLAESRTTYQTWAREQKEAIHRREASEKALAAHLEATQALDLWLKQNVGDAPLGDKLPQLRIAVRDWRSAFIQLEDGRKRHAEAAALKKKLDDAEAGLLQLKQTHAQKDTQAKTARAELEKLSKAWEAQRQVVEHARQVAELDEHRHDLKPGEPCPLCGATEHPFAKGEANFGSQLQSARKLLSSLEQQREKANRDLVALEQGLARHDAELAGEQKRIVELRKALAGMVVPDVVALEAEERTKRSAAGYGEPTNRRHSSLGDESSPLPSDAERELETLERRAATFAKKRDEAAQQRGERQKIEGGILLAKQEEAAKTKRLEELKAEGIALKTKADALKQSLMELLGGRSLAEDRQQYETQVSAAEKTWRDAEAQVNQLQTQIAAAKARLEQFEARRVELEKLINGHETVSGDALGVLEAEAKSLGDELGAKQKESGSLEQRLRSDDEARQRREAGGAELQAAEAESLRWGRLKELIGSADGAKFSRFAQSLTLRQLIGLANEHLKVLAERYRLMAAAGDELDLRIVDLYQASVDRPMESLSGGESFLASLALALGLSELASRHHPIDSLFIDEGFGTLDSETLEIALSALENLRSRGKTIGLISHVELLKERLTTQVRVIRGAGGTSRVEMAA